MMYLDIACNTILCVFLALALWGFRVNHNQDILSNSTVLLLDAAGHAGLILILFATLRIIQNDHNEARVTLPTALSALAACLISLVFGVMIGRSWGYATGRESVSISSRQVRTKSESERRRVIKSKLPTNESDNSLRSIALVADMPMSPPRTRSRENEVPDDNSAAAVIFEAAEVAKSSLLAVLDIRSNASKKRVDDASLRNWKLARTGISSHMWIAKNKTPNIVIKGTCFSAMSVASVVKHLFQNGISTGLEGIIGERATIRTLRRNRVVVSRLACNMGTFTSSKREFLVVTYWAEMENGSVIICTRSLPESFGNQLETSAAPSSASSVTSGSTSGPNTNGHGTMGNSSSSTGRTPSASYKRKGYSRGVIHSCGFVVLPTDLPNPLNDRAATLDADQLTGSPSGANRGCQVLFSADIDMGGSGMAIRRASHHKADAIITYILSLMDDIHETLPGMEYKALNAIPPAPGTVLDAVMTGAGPSSAGGGSVMGLSQDQVHELNVIAKDCINRLAVLHASATSAEFGHHCSKSGIAQLERKWTTFHDQNGITISEYCGSDCPVGTIMASCHVNTSPRLVRKLLVEFPEYVDTLLEEKSVICQLDERSSIQWLAYGAIWPVGATDFLVVTTECSFNSEALPSSANNPLVSHDSFIIASTSVDSVCEDEVEHASAAESATESKYSRSELRLAGYTCTPNTVRGGTDVRLFVDVVAATYIPAWLLQMLAQYGLSEMMNRIRVAAPSLASNEGTGASPIFQPTPSNLDNMLNLIQSREERLREQFGSHLPTRAVRGSSSDSEIISMAAARSDSTRSIDSLNTTSFSRTANEQRKRGFSQPPPMADGEVLSLSNTERGRQLAAESQHLIRVYMGHQPHDTLVFDWQSKAKKGPIEVQSTTVPGSQWFAIMATTVIPHVTTDRLKDFLVDDSNIAGYDDMYDSLEPVLIVDEKTSIRRLLFKAIWPTAPRDFVVCTTWNELPDGSILITSRSAWADLYPEKQGFVRGFLNISGYHITPLPDEEAGCKITMCAHTDLGGSLPSGVINMLSSAAPVKILSAITALTRDS